MIWCLRIWMLSTLCQILSPACSLQWGITPASPRGGFLDISTVLRFTHDTDIRVSERKHSLPPIDVSCECYSIGSASCYRTVQYMLAMRVDACVCLGLHMRIRRCQSLGPNPCIGRGFLLSQNSGIEAIIPPRLDLYIQ